jgi:hypothetical protein
MPRAEAVVGALYSAWNNTSDRLLFYILQCQACTNSPLFLFFLYSSMLRASLVDPSPILQYSMKENATVVPNPVFFSAVAPFQYYSVSAGCKFGICVRTRTEIFSGCPWHLFRSQTNN